MSPAISTEGLILNVLLYMAKAAEQAERYDGESPALAMAVSFALTPLRF